MSYVGDMNKKLGTQQIELIRAVLESENDKLVEIINSGRLDDKLDKAMRERQYNISKILEFF